MPRGLTIDETADRVTIEGHGLGVTFRREGERWVHALTLGGEVASSVEGDPACTDPARVVSPAYQELQRHPIEEGVALLLTGQATPHHFSAVLTARTEGASIVLDFDVADRCRSTLEVLAATYLVAFGSNDLLDAGQERVVWGDRGQLEFAAGANTTVALAEAGRRAARVQVLARIEPSTQTQRLYYRWRWTPDPTALHPKEAP